MKTEEISARLASLNQAIENITDPAIVEVLSGLLNLIEELASENAKQKQIIQKQRDEINRLKGEQGKPDIKANKNTDNDFSCEKERREAEISGEKNKKEGFKLSVPSLDKLREQRIPAEIINSLNKIKGKRYESKAGFFEALEAVIGGESVKLYGNLIAGYARYKKRDGKSKVKKILIDRVVKCRVDVERLPDDAEFKGYKPKIVQDVVFKSDNVLFEREIYWSPSRHKTYIGDVPSGYERDFGPHINSQILSFKYVNNMSIPKIKEFYDNITVLISETYITNRLTGELDVFHDEKTECYEASLEVGDWQQIDDTGSRVNGRNYYTHIVCNDLCTVFFTTPKKDRLTILDILRNFESRSFVFKNETFDLLKQLNVSKKLISKVREATELDKDLSEKEMKRILATLFPDPSSGKISKLRIMEAAAIASYHSKIGIPVVKVLVSDNAPQFKLIVDAHMLCWIHDGRHYKKLHPLASAHRQQLDFFRKRYWEYYRKLYTFKRNPCSELSESLSLEFEELFSTKTGYDELDDRISKTLSKKKNLLTVLKHPEIPLHNNLSENGARVQKRREDVSLQTKTDEGTKAKDTMMSIVETCKRLGVSAYKFIYDRVSQTFELPTLGALIRERAMSKNIFYDSG